MELSRECRAPLLVTHWVSHLLPILPLLLNFYSSHFFWPFSYAGAQLGVNLCESAPRGGMHLVYPPGTSQQFPAFIHLVSRLPLWPLNNFLHASQLGFNV